jgi:ubiquinone biosynthesis protein Coq4
MLKKLQQFKAMLAYKNSGKFGDFALLKSDFFRAKLSPKVVAKLQPLEGYHPSIDLDKLSQYPLGTFGRVYAEHMKANKLQPLNISPELEEIAKRNVFALRYVITHDIFHVLLGFDTSYAGEFGVLVFAAEQNYSQSLKLSLWIAKILYPLLVPWQIKAMFVNLKIGKELAHQADFLLAYKFEEHWLEPIDELRKNLGLLKIATVKT